MSEVPPAIQKKLGESVDTVVKTVRLFHPRKDLDEYQVVRRRCDVYTSSVVFQSPLLAESLLVSRS